jgi:hypothetical protein
VGRSSFINPNGYWMTRGSDQIQEKIFTQDTVNSTFSPADAIIVNMGPLVGATAAAVLGDAFTAIERDGKFAGIWGAKTVLDRTAGALVCFCSEDGGTPIIFYNYSGLVGSTPLCGYPHESYSVSDLTKFTQRQGRLDLNAALYATVRDKVAARVAPYQPSTVQEFPLSLRRLLAMEEAGEISWIQN